jgi:hypothetical protein
MLEQGLFFNLPLEPRTSAIFSRIISKLDGVDAKIKENIERCTVIHELVLSKDTNSEAYANGMKDLPNLVKELSSLIAIK